MKATKSDLTLELECWTEELSPAQLASYEKVANEHNAIKNALKSALTANEGKELFNGEVFQAYSFRGKVLQELKEATLPKKPAKAAEPEGGTKGKGARKRTSALVYLESSDEDDDIPLAKRVGGKKPTITVGASPAPAAKSTPGKKGGAAGAAAKASPQTAKGRAAAKAEKEKPVPEPVTTSPSELTSVGGLLIEPEGEKEKPEPKDGTKETKLQGKTFPSLVVLAKPSLKVKDMSATRSKLDSKVKLVLMLTPNKFTEWLLQEGLLKAEQTCSNHKNSGLKLGVFSDASKFPYSGGYVWLSECCKMRFVSVFHGSIFEGAPHPPSCILKLIYHWSCQTNIQNVVQWVKVDNVYIKGVYTWLRAICTLSVHQKLKKIGGPDRFVEVGVISLGTTSQDGQQRQVKVEVLGVLDHTDKTIRLRAVEPITDLDRNYKKRFQTILEPLQKWVHKDSFIVIDLTVDRSTLQGFGFKNIVQAAATDTTARHNNSVVMDYLRRIVPRMFQNTLSLLSRQMIQQFLDELVWREQFGSYALQAFNNITMHIAEQTRINAPETLVQRLYQVATNPFKDWSVLPANCKEIPPHTAPKRLQKPITEEDYNPQPAKVSVKNIKKEKETKEDKTSAASSAAAEKEKAIPSKRKAAALAASSIAAATIEEDSKLEKKAKTIHTTSSAKAAKEKSSGSSSAKSSGSAKKTQAPVETKPLKKEEDDLKGLEELYYGVMEGKDYFFEELDPSATFIECPICDNEQNPFDSNEKFQTHLVSHISPDDKDYQFQCLFCLEKHQTESVLSKHNLVMHPTETKPGSSASYHCIICTQRYNSLHQLTVHLQKCHNILELPYCCKACGYRSSSHRDVVRHFYDDHKNQNFLQCPFCLDIYRFSFKGKINQKNIENYYMHLRGHVGKKDPQVKCHKCALHFSEKGSLKQHLCNHHLSLLKNAASIKILLNNSLLIAPPKTKTHHRDPLPFVITRRFNTLKTVLNNGATCAECNTDIVNESHYVGMMKCGSCKFVTCCERAMFQHSVDCSNATKDTMELPLPNEMHCLCGFSTAIGNKMANHLVQCGLKTAYSSMQAAQENTVKRNMLDMLGLVRRDGENGGEIDNNEPSVSSMDQSSLTEDSHVNETPSENAPNPAEGASSASSEAPNENVAPIQFGEMEAVPVDYDQQQHHQVVNEAQPQTPNASETFTPLQQAEEEQQQQQQQPQYSISFGQTDVQQHSLSSADLSMSLISDLNDSNAQNTSQFLSDVNMPMFDTSAAPDYPDYQNP